MVIGEFQFQNIERHFGVHNLYQTIFTNTLHTLIRISKGISQLDSNKTEKSFSLQGYANTI